LTRPRTLYTYEFPKGPSRPWCLTNWTQKWGKGELRRTQKEIAGRPVAGDPRSRRRRGLVETRGRRRAASGNLTRTGSQLGSASCSPRERLRGLAGCGHRSGSLGRGLVTEASGSGERRMCGAYSQPRDYSAATSGGISADPAAHRMGGWVPWPRSPGTPTPAAPRRRVTCSWARGTGRPDCHRS
jgi:hypothetical protein